MSEKSKPFQLIGWAVEITRADGSKFFAAPARGVVTPAWNLANGSYASAFASELKEAGFNARRVKVIYTHPKLLQ